MDGVWCISHIWNILRHAAGGGFADHQLGVGQFQITPSSTYFCWWGGGCRKCKSWWPGKDILVEMEKVSKQYSSLFSIKLREMWMGCAVVWEDARRNVSGRNSTSCAGQDCTRGRLVWWIFLTQAIWVILPQVWQLLVLNFTNIISTFCKSPSQKDIDISIIPFTIEIPTDLQTVSGRISMLVLKSWLEPIDTWHQIFLQSDTAVFICGFNQQHVLSLLMPDWDRRGASLL